MVVGVFVCFTLLYFSSVDQFGKTGQLSDKHFRLMNQVSSVLHVTLPSFALFVQCMSISYILHVNFVTACQICAARVLCTAVRTAVNLVVGQCMCHTSVCVARDSRGRIRVAQGRIRGQFRKDGQANLSRAQGSVEGTKRDNTSYSVLCGESTVYGSSSARQHVVHLYGPFTLRLNVKPAE